MVTLIPAYGRDYKSQKEVEEDFYADKDFKICDISNQWDGRYVNNRQLKDSQIKQARIRYKKLTLVHILNTGDKPQ